MIGSFAKAGQSLESSIETKVSANMLTIILKHGPLIFINKSVISLITSTDEWCSVMAVVNVYSFLLLAKQSRPARLQ